MLLVVSGEGPSDIGTRQPGNEGYVFVPGPMTILVDQLLELQLHYSLLDVDQVRFVAKAELVDAAAKHRGRQFRAPGKHRPKEAGYYYENALRLAHLARELASEAGSPVIAVFFRDADGVQSAGRGEWHLKWASILAGFMDGGCETGVPMLPQPKSEAWLLCALREPSYQHCARLEQESGNDDSPNPLKAQLALVCDGATSALELADAVRNGHVDAQRIDMPSYNAFREQLVKAVGRMLGRE